MTDEEEEDGGVGRLLYDTGTVIGSVSSLGGDGNGATSLATIPATPLPVRLLFLFFHIPQRVGT